MLVDSYSEIKQFYGETTIEAVNEANRWIEENRIITTGLICFSTLPSSPLNGVRWCVLVTYNKKEPLNAVGEVAKERMPKDIPYIPKGKPEGARHH